MRPERSTIVSIITLVALEKSGTTYPTKPIPLANIRRGHPHEFGEVRHTGSRRMWKKMHIGRSRNDLIATTLRLYVNDQLEISKKN